MTKKNLARQRLFQRQVTCDNFNDLLTFSGSISCVANNRSEDQELVLICKTKAQKANVQLLKVGLYRLISLAHDQVILTNFCHVANLHICRSAIGRKPSLDFFPFVK